MNTRLGIIMFWTGLIGAAMCILYTVDAVFVYESGKSILYSSAHFASREDMLLAVIVGVVLALFFPSIGATAQSFVNKSAEERAAAKVPQS